MLISLVGRYLLGVSHYSHQANRCAAAISLVQKDSCSMHVGQIILRADYVDIRGRRDICFTAPLQLYMLYVSTQL